MTAFLATAAVILVWYFFVHRILSERLLGSVTDNRFLARMLSLVTLVVALVIVWSIIGISVLQYAAPMLQGGQ